jgi:hypothetical protein
MTLERSVVRVGVKMETDTAGVDMVMMNRGAGKEVRKMPGLRL